MVVFLQLKKLSFSFSVFRWWPFEFIFILTAIFGLELGRVWMACHCGNDLGALQLQWTDLENLDDWKAKIYWFVTLLSSHDMTLLCLYARKAICAWSVHSDISSHKRLESYESHVKFHVNLCIALHHQCSSSAWFDLNHSAWTTTRRFLLPLDPWPVLGAETQVFEPLTCSVPHAVLSPCAKPSSEESVSRKRLVFYGLNMLHFFLSVCYVSSFACFPVLSPCYLLHFGAKQIPSVRCLQLALVSLAACVAFWLLADFLAFVIHISIYIYIFIYNYVVRLCKGSHWSQNDCCPVSILSPQEISSRVWVGWWPFRLECWRWLFGHHTCCGAGSALTRRRLFGWNGGIQGQGRAKATLHQTSTIFEACNGYSSFLTLVIKLLAFSETFLLVWVIVLLT